MIKKQGSLSKREIKSFLEKKLSAADTLKAKRYLTKEKLLGVKARSGLFGGEAEIFGLQVVGVAEPVRTDVSLNDFISSPNQRSLELDFRIKIRISFVTYKGWCITEVPYDEITVYDAEQCISFDRVKKYSNDYPSYFGFHDKKDFVTFKKSLKSLFSEAKLLQRGVFYKSHQEKTKELLEDISSK